MLDPMQLEFQPYAPNALKNNLTQQNPEVVVHTTEFSNVPAGIVNTEDELPLNIHKQAVDIEGGNILQETEGETSESSSALPGFPVPAFINQAHTICPGSQHRYDKIYETTQDAEVPPQIQTEEDLIGREGAKIWKSHFAPTIRSKEVIQVPSDWVISLAINLLSPYNFEWAKKYVTSNVWAIIK